MRRIDWTDPESLDDTAGRSANGYTYSASRVLVGHCPDCNNVLVVFNDHESWPLIGCTCGWTGGTTEVAGYMVRTRADA